MIGQASVGAANAVADLSALQDSFLTFAHKVAAIVEGLPKAEKANQTKTFGALQARFKDQLRFSTKPLNKTMLNAALAVGSALPAESRAQRVLRLLQLWYPSLFQNYGHLYKAATLTGSFLQSSKGAMETEELCVKLLCDFFFWGGGVRTQGRDISYAQ